MVFEVGLVRKAIKSRTETVSDLKLFFWGGDFVFFEHVFLTITQKWPFFSEPSLG